MDFYDKDAECAIIGAMIESCNYIPHCLETLSDKVFRFTPNRILFTTVQMLYEQNTPVNIVTITDKLEKNDDLNRIGGQEYVEEIVFLASSKENLQYYINRVRELNAKRQLLMCGNKFKRLVEEDISVEEMLSKSQDIVSQACDVKKPIEDIKAQANAAHARLRDMSEGRYIQLSTGFPCLDLMVQGLQKQKYYIVAGLPSVGKSAFIHNIIYHIAVELQRPVVLYCYESDASTVILRMVSLATKTNLFENAKSAINDEKVLNVFSRIKNSSLIIIDNCPPTIEYATAHTRTLKTEHPDLALVAYDHIHQMSTENKYNNREQVVSAISTGLKRIAKSCDVPIIGVSQMSRASIRRQERKPSLDDLRASGALEFGADVVMFVYREDYYESMMPSPVSETEVIIRKNRDGPVGTIKYSYHRAISRFDEYDY